MEAPDKIYVPESKDCSGCIDMKVFAEYPLKHGIAYIRKDAILEWLCDRKKVAELTFSDSTELAGYMSAVTDFMNKFKLQ